MRPARLLFLLVATVLISFASACAPKSGDRTRVVGQFAENAPETVRFSRGYYDGAMDEDHYVSFFDTTVAVVNGHFELEIPKCLTSQTECRFGNDFVPFISDGTTITIDPEARTAVSSDKKGQHSQYMDFGNRWNDYQANMAGFGTDLVAQEKYRDDHFGALQDYTKEVARNNLDNITGLMALEQLYFSSLDPSSGSDPKEMLALVNGLSDEIKADPMSSFMVTELRDIYTGLVKSTEGSAFLDFTIVQDPEHPETSTVHLSDYVGKGKYVLVDFWASWCGPCRAEIPNLINVYNTYHGENFDMLSVAVADKVEDSVKAAKELGIVWNQIVNAQQIPGNVYGFDAIPLIILFGPDGTILKRDLRGEQISEAVKEALGL